jgi:hypothetical protein
LALEDGVNRPFILCLLCAAVIAVVAARAYGLAESTGQGGSNAQAVHDLGQIGTGVNIGLVAEENVYTQHYAFFDKDPNGDNTGSTHVFNIDYTGDGNSPWIHDTWMSGIAISRGSASHPEDIGVAPGADVYCARVIDSNGQLAQSWLDGSPSAHNGALDELINTYGCRVIMTGFAGTDTPDGQSILTLMYDYYADTYDVVFTPGAGNGNTDIWVAGDIYNGLCTGGLTTDTRQAWDKVGLDSSSGPTTDDRNKPDLVAPAQKQYMPHTPPDNWKYWNEPPEGATSLSGPHTAGIAALLLGLADSTAGESDDGHSEVIRAVIVNSAFPNIRDKAGQSTNPADPNNVWNEDRGYGRVDALRAYQLLDSNSVSAGSATTQNKGWAYDTLGGSQVHTYSITAAKNERLVLTVSWDRRPTRNWKLGAYAYSDESSPKFNIDLTVKDPNGITVFYGNETLNNLEKADLLLLKDGQYVITLENTTTKVRDYGMAFELIPPLVADFNIDYVVDKIDLKILTQDWLQTDSVADLTGTAEVNLKDFAAFANRYTNSNPLYH